MPMDPFSSPYLWIKALHVISVITWMAGLFYLPRLYVYHAAVDLGSETGRQQSETFKVMERRLLRGIMHPSLVVVFATGGLLAPTWIVNGWLHVKLLMVVGMLACHLFYARWRQDFLHDRNQRPHTFYRVANEVPTLLLLVIVAMVVVKPF